MSARRSVRAGSVRRGSVRLGSIRRSGAKRFVSIWNTENLGGTSSATKTIVLPMTAGPLVDWGDGTVNNLNTHVYAVGGIYEITIDECSTSPNPTA